MDVRFSRPNRLIQLGKRIVFQKVDQQWLRVSPKRPTSEIDRCKSTAVCKERHIVDAEVMLGFVCCVCYCISCGLSQDHTGFCRSLPWWASFLHPQEEVCSYCMRRIMEIHSVRSLITLFLSKVLCPANYLFIDEVYINLYC